MVLKTLYYSYVRSLSGVLTGYFKDIRKRLFDSGVNSSTPDVTRKERSSRRVSGRCLIPTIIVEEEVDSRGSEQTHENEEFVHGFSTSTKSLPWKLSSTPSPKKHHPYSRDFSRGKVCHNAAQALSQKTRTPPRKGSLHSSPITKFPSFSELPEYRNPRRPRYGAQHVDFLWCLGKERMMAPALSLVLSSLSGEDLMACSAVSKTWRTLIMSDRTANSRRLAAIEKRKLRKENMSQIPSKDRVAFLKENRSVLGVIQKERLFPPEGSILKTPPPKMSPKTLKFGLYMKVSYWFYFLF
ncbi:uncharacterized protein LOC124174195 [Ischnura elegans]|uniref:uncharacterized protein LOC124174195 n=1 Tax=Ischnura elegans TaxID=197161 RepID=UPI001ED86A0B|nr:uncharacterized protein LOC124174195 [Ischnura elegans]